MVEVPDLLMNDGRRIPQLGLGVWQAPAEQTAEVVRTAVAAGYRLVDTASVYRNEAGVGEGVRSAAAPRGDIFVTTKLWNAHQGFDEALTAFDKSLGRLGLDYVDLYLIHWPQPMVDRYVDSWRALIRLREEGRARSIGVSNFMPEHIDRLIAETGVTPAVNQIELHPRFQQAASRAHHAATGVLTESWSPLGRSTVIDLPLIQDLARKHGRTPAQVILRWHLELGLVVIPKSVTPSRIAENIDVFDFRLDASDMAALARLDDPGGRVGPDPMSMTFA